ncbi:MAG: hypothetical protein ACHP79_09915, partial [Terriglobales bacterium]
MERGTPMKLQSRLTLTIIAAAVLLLGLAVSAYSRTTPPSPTAPVSAGVVDYLGALRTPADVKGKPSGFKRVVNKILGLDADHRGMALPHGVAVDGSGRVLVADTKGQVVHMFDAAGRKYKQLHPPDSDP